MIDANKIALEKGKVFGYPAVTVRYAGKEVYLSHIQDEFDALSKEELAEKFKDKIAQIIFELENWKPKPGEAFKAYTCPMTGETINSWGQRAQVMRQHGVTDYEPSAEKREYVQSGHFEYHNAKLREHMRAKRYGN